MRSLRICIGLSNPHLNMESEIMSITSVSAPVARPSHVPVVSKSPPAPAQAAPAAAATPAPKVAGDSDGDRDGSGGINVKA